MFPENSTRVDRSAQRPPEVVDIPVDRGQAEQLTDQALDSEEAGVELDRRVPELNETVVNEDDRSATGVPTGLLMRLKKLDQGVMFGFQHVLKTLFWVMTERERWEKNSMLVAV